ncbi:cobalamin/Fe3+-siderophore ABC transporter ATPase [Halogeometricum borinquense DSM 11551]|uniref:Cobalamin import ATP-binding protein BtuD n=2 Tax=Halogeometricum borinquense TaxID=60847 RepID=E4NLD5_HALBP|nr:ABC-type cobalamin/Fe3+-siderophore transport system, ATPase component [Halogeometricum borinquense DSM 11551]ELY27472.1 cobalamin/Fe3+-siderophore ABC transporter ATPase [Halogeometricum borinquense DSM 11551]
MAESEYEHMTVEQTQNKGEQTDVVSALVGDDLTLSYATTDQPVVECDRIDIPRGEITALVGPNGSGKSTLLKALSKQLAPDTGNVLLDGQTIQEYGDKEFARELGLLSQENDSPNTITVEELAYHGRYPHRGFFEQVSEEDEEAVERAIDLAGVDHIRDQTVGNLSGGQKQLAWIAMVLAQDTDVLLLDEPTTYLDLHHQLRVMETVQQLNDRRDVTIAVVLHDIAQAARFADYLIALQDGEVYDWGPPREVVTEELLADVFRVEAAVSYTPDPEIIPKHSL